MYKFERKIIDFCETHVFSLFLILITILALAARFFMLDYLSLDYTACLEPWYYELKAAGGLKGLATYTGNYNPPYVTIMALLTYLPFDSLYTLKAISIISDILLAISVGKLTSYLSKDNNKLMFMLGYSIVLFIPSVLFNGGMWGQCDALYTFFIIYSLLYLLKEEYNKSFLMFGLAFSFKLQAVFIIPLYIIYYVCKKRFSILKFFIIPLTDVVLCIPALIAGRSLRKCLGVYFHQTETYAERLTLNFLNVYSIFNGEPQILNKVGVIVAIAICGIALLYCVCKKPKFNNEQIITFGLWFLIVMTFVLPSMHERYLYVGEALAVVYLLVYKKNFGIMNYVIFSPLLTYGYYFFGSEIENTNLIVIGYLILIIIFTIHTFKLLDNSKK